MQLRAVDLLKFVMALAVVAIHTRTMCGIPVEWNLTHFAIHCSLPFFFITSGYLIARKFFTLPTREQRTHLLRKNALKFTRLYLGWLIVYIPAAVYFYFTNDTPFQSDLVDYLRGIVFYGESPYAWPLWYVFSVAAVLWVVYVFYRFRLQLWPLFILAFASVILDWLVESPNCPGNSDNHTIRFIFNLAKLLAWRPFYAIAFFLLSAAIYRYRQFMQRPIVGFGLGIVLLLLGFALYYFHLPLWRHAVGSALFIAAAATHLQQNHIFLYLRRLSEGIYFLHMYVLLLLSLIVPQYFTPAAVLTTFAIAAPATILLAAAYNAVKQQAIFTKTFS